MKRTLVLVLLLVGCGGLQGCAAAIIGGGGKSDRQCDQRDSRNCPKQEAF